MQGNRPILNTRSHDKFQTRDGPHAHTRPRDTDHVESPCIPHTTRHTCSSPTTPADIRALRWWAAPPPHLPHPSGDYPGVYCRPGGSPNVSPPVLKTCPPIVAQECRCGRRWANEGYGPRMSGRPLTIGIYGTMEDSPLPEGLRQSVKPSGWPPTVLTRGGAPISPSCGVLTCVSRSWVPAECLY